MAHHRHLGMSAQAQDTRGHTCRAGASATQDLPRQPASTQGGDIRSRHRAYASRCGRASGVWEKLKDES